MKWITRHVHFMVQLHITISPLIAIPGTKRNYTNTHTFGVRIRGNDNNSLMWPQLKKKWERNFCSLSAYVWIIKYILENKVLNSVCIRRASFIHVYNSRMTVSLAQFWRKQSRPNSIDDDFQSTWTSRSPGNFPSLQLSAMCRRGQTLSPELKINITLLLPYVPLSHSLTKPRTRAHVSRIYIYYRLMASGNHGCCGEWKTEMKTLRMFHKRTKKNHRYR